MSEDDYRLGYETGEARERARVLRLLDSEIERLERTWAGHAGPQASRLYEVLANLRRIRSKVEDL